MTTNNDKWKNTVLTFNGLPHSLLQILAVAKSCPLIDVELSLVNLDLSKELLVVSECSDEINGKDLIVYKYQGKILVFAGRDKITSARAEGRSLISARLISTPTLKSTRIEGGVKRILMKVDPIEVVSETKTPPRHKKAGGFLRHRGV